MINLISIISFIVISYSVWYMNNDAHISRFLSKLLIFSVTMYILVTSDISGGTGRFSMTLGLTTAAMSIGGTVSGYLGEALAQDIGYMEAFFILAIMSLIPALVYLLFMPETLANFHKTSEPHALGSIQSIQEMPNEDGDKPYVELT